MIGAPLGFFFVIQTNVYHLLEELLQKLEFLYAFSDYPFQDC